MISILFFLLLTTFSPCAQGFTPFTSSSLQGGAHKHFFRHCQISSTLFSTAVLDDFTTLEGLDESFEQVQWLMPSIVERALIHNGNVDPYMLLDRLDMSTSTREEALQSLDESDAVLRNWPKSLAARPWNDSIEFPKCWKQRLLQSLHGLESSFECINEANVLGCHFTAMETNGQSTLP